MKRMKADIGGESGDKYANPYSRKPEGVKNMFARVAKVYDPINRAMCFGLDILWRKRLVRTLLPPERRECGAKIIDVACGSGDVSLETLIAYPAAEVVGVDFCPEMLNAAKRKLSGSPHCARAEFMEADCEKLPFGGESFDGATLAFGFRNFNDRQKCLLEIFRVLKPGAVMAMLEVSRGSPFIRPIQKLFMCGFVPAVARMLGGDSRDYSYLGESAMSYPPKAEVESMFAEAGFCGIRTESMGFGMVAITSAKKPSGGGVS